MYGYGSGWGYGSGKKSKGSVSGWENSHFGGIKRILTDYPYIEFPFELDIKADKELLKDLGHWMGEKLIKLYLLKAVELNAIEHFKQKIEERTTFLGKKEKYAIISLKENNVFDAITATYAEISVLFEEYKKEIFNTTIELKLDGEGEGDGDGDGDDESEEGEDGENQGEEGEGEDEENQEGKGEGEGEGEENQDGKGKGGGKGEGEGDDGEFQKEQKIDGHTRKGKSIQEYVKEIKEFKANFGKTSRVGNFDKTAKFKKLPSISKTDYQFTDDERRIGDNLVKMLDISFDPKSDEVKNLKLGKLDTSKLAEVPAGNISVYKQTVEEQDTKPFSVCVLGDLSGSMGCNGRARYQFTLMNALYYALSQILPLDKMFFYGHTGYDSPDIYTFHSPYDQNYLRNIQSYWAIELYENYDGPVIEEIHKKIRSTTEDRIIFISITDGLPSGNGYGGQTDNEDLKRIIEKARRDSFVTIGIGIEAEHVSQLYQYSKSVFNLGTLARDVSGVINKVVKSEFQ